MSDSQASRNSAGSLRRNSLTGTASRTLFLAVTVALLSGQTLSAPAATKPTDFQPSRGTMLIPLIPKIDTSRTSSQATSAAKAAPAAQNQPGSAAPSHKIQYDAEISADSEAAAAKGNKLAPAPDKISPELGNIETEDTSSEATEIGSDTTLKGTIQLVADDTEYDQLKNTFLGTGNAVVYIGGQDSKLEADTILYDQNHETIDARGNVRIYRDGQVTTGSAFKFKVTSDEYLITKPDTELQGTTVVARKGQGSKTGMAFRDARIELPKPLHLFNNSNYGPMGTAEMISEQTAHPDAYAPANPSFKFKARKIVYERYKENNNITIFGGKVMFGSFGIPLPKMTLTAGAEERGAVVPISPLIANNMQMGGTSIGPMFNRRVLKSGVFSWAPLLQLGGSTLASGDPDKRSVGFGARIQYIDEKNTVRLAYGTNSNLLVAEAKHQFNDRFKLQSGINRYLEDGVFGYRRARLLGEAVYNKGVSGIPFITGINFRTAAGFAQDDPDLLNQTPSLEKLYNLQGNQGKLFALRVQEQATLSTLPIFSLGDNRVGTKFFIYGGAGIKGYSTGDTLALAQVGPILDVRLHRLRLQGGYTQSGTSGKSPFVFDQFIQGSRSTSLNGDIRLSRYLTVGGMVGYNLDAKAMYQKTIKVAIGPDDFKVLLSHDTLSGFNRFGFNVFYKAPVNTNKLVLKGAPDTGKLGGI
jgi:lipopolysaccharide export system protein LptA